MSSRLGYSAPGKADFWTEEMPRLMDLLRRARASAAPDGSTKKKKSMTLRQVAEMLEPSYDSFYCPLTRKIMDDPVAIANGATYERRAVAKWFETHGPVCPASGEKLGSSAVEGNVALRETIEGWRRKSEEARVKLACVALALAGPSQMVAEAMMDLRRLCARRPASMELARELGAARLLGQLLETEAGEMRCEALKALTFFTGDDEGKERIGSKQIESAVRILSSDDPLELETAATFLLELSKSATCCRKIGLVPGAIMMLIALKFNKAVDASLAEKASKSLENLEKYPSNIKLMAEDGYLEPLLKGLVEGSSETKIEMAKILGQLTLPQQAKGHASSQAISTLLEMARSPEPHTRMPALNALAQFSSHPFNATMLVQSGAVTLMIESMFTGSILIVPSSASTYHRHHASILANMLDHLNEDPESLQIDSQGHTMTSHYAVYNLIHMLNASASHALNLDVLRILLRIASSKSKKPADRIAKALREIDSLPLALEFARSDHEPLALAALRLLLKLTPHIGAAISEKLCTCPAQPDAILEWLRPTGAPTERHIASAELLAQLPSDYLPLTRTLLAKNALPLAIAAIAELSLQGRAVVSRHGRLLLEGLVGVLVRFTAVCHDAEVLRALVENDVGTALVGLLGSASEEVLALSTLGLQNLSALAAKLSKRSDPAEDDAAGAGFDCLACCFGSRRRYVGEETWSRSATCRVHGGLCSPTTFCLAEMGAVERLVGLLEHESDTVVSGALSALRRLVEGEAAAGEGVRVVGGCNGVKATLAVVEEEGRGEEVRHAALWLAERFLASGIGEFAEEVAGDKVLHSFLVRGLHHGDGEVRGMCENMLRYLNKMPRHRQHEIVR